MAKKKFYAVVHGRKPGIYGSWAGPQGAEKQIKAYPAARFKGFARLEDALHWFETQSGGVKPRLYLPKEAIRNMTDSAQPTSQDEGRVVIYTDGGSTGNPGPGGYGVVIIQGKERREISGGYRLTTNNRMELMACIAALAAVDAAQPVTLYSDSKYVVEAFNRGWVYRWQANRWLRNGRRRVENVDLWKKLLKQVSGRDVRFVWVAGHAGTRENERCDRLAVQAARRKNLPPDKGFESQAGEQPHLL